MTHSMFRQRLLAAAVVLSAAALPAAAQQAQQTQDTQSQTAPTANAMTVTRDADTGKLRASTAAEQAQLSAQKAKTRVRAAVQRPMTKYHRSGAVGARLTDDFIAGASLIAVRQPDGKVALEHGDPASVGHVQATVPAPTHTTPAAE